VLCSRLNFQRTVDFNFLNISEKEDIWFGFFDKHQNQRITDPSYFKNLKAPVVFHERTSGFLAGYLIFSIVLRTMVIYQ
jgi:hypothetical protein